MTIHMKRIGKTRSFLYDKLHMHMESWAQSVDVRMFAKSQCPKDDRPNTSPPPTHGKKLLSRTRSRVLFSAEYIFKSSHREYFCFYSRETCTQSSWSDLISFLQSEWYAAPVSFTHSQFLNIHKQMPIPKETISLDAARWNMYCSSRRHGSEIF